MKKLILFVLLIGALPFISGLAVAQTASDVITKGVVKLDFINDQQAGYPLQDVYVVGPTSKFPDIIYGQVFRLSGSDQTNPNQTIKNIFTATEAIPRNLMQTGTSPLGPFTRGKDMGISLLGWLKAAGNGTMTINEGGVDLDLFFTDLQPYTQYSVWCSRWNMTAGQASMTSEAPCGSANGSDNFFNTDSMGGGRFIVHMGGLPPSTKNEKSVISIVYNSDGQRHGTTPGEYGLNAHRQLFAFVPTKVEHLVRVAEDTFIEQGMCAGNAAKKRDETLIKAYEEYSAALKPALEARQITLTDAWRKDKNSRTSALKKAWSGFQSAVRDAWKDLSKARNEAWSEYRKNRKGCGVTSDPTDDLNQAFDAKL